MECAVSLGLCRFSCSLKSKWALGTEWEACVGGRNHRSKLQLYLTMAIRQALFSIYLLLEPIFPSFCFTTSWCFRLSFCPPSSSCFSSALSFLRPLLYGQLCLSYSREEYVMLSFEQPRTPCMGHHFSVTH